MKKSFLKNCMAIMTAVMVVGTPLTALAEETSYTIPSVDWTTDQPANLEMVFSDGFSWTDEGVISSYVPEGYKIIAASVDYSLTPCYWWCDCIVEGIKDVEWLGNSIPNAEGYYYNNKYTVEWNGVAYSECKLIEMSDSDWWHEWIFVLPQSYDGEVSVTISGAKLENGEVVKDDNSIVTHTLQSGSTVGQFLSTTEEQIAAAELANAEFYAETAAGEQTAVVTAYTGTIYITKRGDNLSKIAREFYGDSSVWRAIYEMNKNVIKDPNKIWANQVFVLP